MKNHLFTAVLLAFVAFTGCKKQESNHPLPYDLSNGNNNNNLVVPTPTAVEIFKTTSHTPQQYTVDATQQATVTGTEGTRLFIAPNSFVTQNGTPVTGNVSVQLVELYNYNDLLLNNKPTQSEGKLLETAGSFYISASQNGDALKLASGKSITGFGKLNTGMKPTDMKLFYGEEANGQFNWKEAPAGGMVARDTSTTFDSTTIEKWFMEFTVDSLKWINCDRFYNLSTVKVTVKTPAENTVENTIVYVVVKDINGVMGVYYNATDKIWRDVSVPDGYKVSVLSISKKGSVYQSAIKKDVIISGNTTINLTYNPDTEAGIKNLMKTL